VTTATERAPAKVNLALHIVGQDPNDYHLLDSLVVFTDTCDVLSIAPSDTMALRVDGPFAAGVPIDHRNLVWRAAELAGVALDITLTKNLPHGAGVGGGSSDAAAILRAVDRPDLALDLGADVPVCLSAAPQRMQGIGERIAPVPACPSLSLVLVNPGVHLGTVEVFKALTNKTNPGLSDIPGQADADWLEWLAGQRNDLEAPAMQLAPVIGDVLDTLADAQLARMSGSGATCFGIYEDKASAQVAAERILREHPDWWVVACQPIGADDQAAEA